jgi:ABC-type lipoprotein release transport system permease subunit
MDLVVFGGVLLFLGGWALLVGYLPARRAAAADPVVVLRAE